MQHFLPLEQASDSVFPHVLSSVFPHVLSDTSPHPAGLYMNMAGNATASSMPKAQAQTDKICRTRVTEDFDMQQ